MIFHDSWDILEIGEIVFEMGFYAEFGVALIFTILDDFREEYLLY